MTRIFFAFCFPESACWCQNMIRKPQHQKTQDIHEEKASKRVDVVRVKLCLYHVSDCLYIFGKTDLGKILDSCYRYTTNTKDIIAVVIMGKMSAGNRRTLDDWTNRFFMKLL